MSISTDSSDEGIINRVFPEELFDGDGTVKSDASSISIDYDKVKVRISGMPKITPEQEDELDDFLEKHKDELSFKSGEDTLITQEVIDEMQELLKENPVVSSGPVDAAAPTDPNAAPTDQGDGANNQPPQAQPIEVTLNAGQLKDAINEGVGNLIEDETNVQFTEDGKLKISVQKEPGTAGGKSKKKQMKPKNKSNKKMKKKQTKKGGKQIKKRSLKRKMKK